MPCDALSAAAAAATAERRRPATALPSISRASAMASIPARAACRGLPARRQCEPACGVRPRRGDAQIALAQAEMAGQQSDDGGIGLAVARRRMYGEPEGRAVGLVAEAEYAILRGFRRHPNGQYRAVASEAERKRHCRISRASRCKFRSAVVPSQ